jgi:hypothetical protein
VKIYLIALFFHHFVFIEDEKKRQVGRVAGEKV